MKRFALLIAVFFGFLASGCGGSATRSAADFTIEVYTPEYASGFDIRGRDKDAATLVTVRNPWQGPATSSSTCSSCARGQSPGGPSTPRS